MLMLLDWPLRKKRVEKLCVLRAPFCVIPVVQLGQLCKTCQHDKYYFYHTDGCEWLASKMDGNAEGRTWAYPLMVG
jgi:hypothetical protein